MPPLVTPLTGRPPCTCTPADPGEEQRPCAGGDWCVSDDAVTRGEGGTRIVTSALGYRAFCDSDRARVRDSLAELPGKHEALYDELGKPGTLRRHKQGKLASGPLLIRLDV